MATTVHRVRRIRWRVRAASEATALAVRARLRAGTADLIADLAGALDDVAAGDDVVYVARLEVRTAIDAGQLDERLAAVVAAALRRQLDALLGAGGGRRRRPAEAEAELLATYLRTGLPPWQVAAEPPMVAATRLRAAARTAPRAALAALADLAWPQRRAALGRLLQLVEPHDWPALAEPAAGAVGAARAAALRLLAAAADLPRAVREHLAAALLAIAGDDDRRHAAGEAAACLATAAPEPALDAALAACLAGPAASLLQPPARSAPRSPERASTPPSGERAAAPVGQSADAVAHPPRAAAGAPPAAADLPCTVPYAGLVILHPFLPRLLRATGLWAGGTAPLAPATHRSAAALLACVATGRREALDLELGFIKVLLGLRPESPLPPDGRPLAASDVAEVEALLAAVVAHWSALGRSAPATLRTAFLQRPGRLAEDELGWRLDVEPRGHDVLLDRLPWGFRTARLPWMRQPIATTWPAP